MTPNAFSPHLTLNDAQYAAQTAFIHGEQSWGTLFAEGDGAPVPLTDNHAASYIQQSLEVLGITPDELRKMHVFNIGSGRESVIFQQMGAGQVTHLDIALQNVENVRRYAAKHSLRNLASLHADVQTAKLLSEQFDLIFLAAVYPHIQTPARALANLAQALKIGGRMYLGFLRSGEWKCFVVDAVRYLLGGSDFTSTRNKIALSCSMGQKVHYQTGRMVVDFFGPCQHKFHPDDVIHDARQLGLEVFHFDNDRREYSHEGRQYFSIGGDRIYLIKKEKTPASADWKNLRTVRGRNQLSDVPYSEAAIRSNVERIRQLRSMIEGKVISQDEAAVLAINLYRFARPFEPEYDEYYQNAVRQGRHAALQEYLQNVIELYGGAR